jgi:protein TonB
MIDEGIFSAASGDIKANDGRSVRNARFARLGNSPLRRRTIAIAAGVGAIALLGAAIRLLFTGNDMPAPRKAPEIKLVTILPPPPPPPPPPPKAPEKKMIDQTPVKQEIPEEKPIDTPKEAPKPKDSPKADEPPPGPLALDAKAAGPGDSFNLGGKPGGRGILGGGGGGGGGSRWGWYASIVQQQIESALRANARTRNAVMQIQVRLWVDASGRVSRSQLISSSGNPELDAAIRNEVLPGITLREPPPKDMPMPIVARISERRPA